MTDSNTKVVNCKKSEYGAYIGRGRHFSHMNNTEIGEDGWIGNPYTVVEHGRDKAIDLFERDFYGRIESDDEFREAVEELEGETLGCHCKPKRCHGDVIKNYLENNRQSLFEY